MHISIYFTLLVVSFLASLSGYFQKNVQTYLRLFPIFLFVTIIVEIVSAWMSSRGKPATTLYNFFSCFEFLFYMYVLRVIIHRPRAKKIVFHIAWIYALLGVANVLFIQKFTSYNSLTYALGCLLIAIICIYYFFELFQLTSSVSLLRLPAFWICAGLLFFYCCSFPIFGLLNYLNHAPAIIKKNIGVIILLLNVFLYSSFTIAFLCRIRARNSTS
jgi:hypothetical protein